VFGGARSRTESAFYGSAQLSAGPITRVEALEIPKLIDDVRADLRDPKIGILDPKIELYAYATMAELERALPALLDTLAKGTGSAAAIEQPQRRVSSLSDKQTVASDLLPPRAALQCLAPVGTTNNAQAQPHE
jgi:hypothetical protein